MLDARLGGFAVRPARSTVGHFKIGAAQRGEDRFPSLHAGGVHVETAIEEAKDGIGATKSEIKSLRATIKALDKSVAEATAQRKAENEDFTELMAQDSAARELLGFAKNRLPR